MVGGQTRTATHNTAAAAAEWLAAERASVRERQARAAGSLDALTVRYLVERFRDEYLGAATGGVGARRRGALGDLGHVACMLAEPLASTPLSDLTPDIVRTWSRKIAVDVAAATVVKRVNLLARILVVAATQWSIPVQNCARAADVARPEAADERRDRRLIVLSPTQRRRLTEQGVTDPEDEIDVLLRVVAVRSGWTAIVRFALAQGARQGEILSLQWRDVDYDREEMKVWGVARRGTKTRAVRSERDVERRPITPDAIDILRAIQPASAPPGQPVFSPGPNFKVEFGRAIARAISKLPVWQKDVGYLQDLRFHDLRHEAISELARLLPDRDLMRVSGHRTVTMLHRYYHPEALDITASIRAARAARATEMAAVE